MFKSAVLEMIQSAPSKPVVREEPEKIKKWREEQKTRLEEKGKLSYSLIGLGFFTYC